MQPLNQNDLKRKIDSAYRVLVIIWLASLTSVGILFAMSVLIPHANGEAQNKVMSYLIDGLGALCVIISTVIKSTLLNQSVQQQRMEGVVTAYIVPLSLCEAAALFGLLDHFVIGNPYYYLLFIISIAGFALHWPRRQHLLDASFRQP
jgi:hypothetical protein